MRGRIESVTCRFASRTSVSKGAVMCCEDGLPAVVGEMLAGYRALLSERGHDWGDEWQVGYSKAFAAVLLYCDREKLVEVSAELAAADTVGREMAGGDVLRRDTVPADVIELVVRALPDPLPAGVAIADGVGVKVRTPLPFAVAERPMRYQVIVMGEAGGPAMVSEAVVSVDEPELAVNGRRTRAVDPVVSGRLRLVSDAASRWTVLDERGGAWFPDDALRKYDFHGRPFFHGNNVSVVVPSGRVTVQVARGCEFRPASVEIEVPAGADTMVELSPSRLYDAAARGWYGGDLHVHTNYSGDLVCAPSDAARMQHGEALHLMNLVAANANTALIYDRQAFEHFAGEDLPWSDGDQVVRWGVEYRNDLLGHFHALNLAGPPSRYQTGHTRSDEPQDWPPNAVAAAECRDLGATVGYTHPVMVPFGDDGSPAAVFEQRHSRAEMGLRTMHARELVADAALGLVDSVDLTGNHTARGGTESTEYLYHRLLGCGLRLAATAGTDCMLSRSRASFLSNPPGWSRAYANLRGKPLSVQAWQEAVREGRTFATNGPWLEISVDASGPGDVVSLDRSGSATVAAHVVGLGVDALEIVGPNGTIATTGVAPDGEHAGLTTTLEVTEPMWLAAIARGSGHPTILGPNVYAHTSPIWVELAGKSIARPDDAAWCIDWLDRFETLVRKEGNFPETGKLQELVDVINRARIFYRDITASGRLVRPDVN